MGNKNLDLNSISNISYQLAKTLPPSKTRIEERIFLLKLPETIQNATHLGKLKKTYGCGSNILVGPPVASMSPLQIGDLQTLVVNSFMAIPEPEEKSKD